jgi:precorrin-6B methylase 2
MTRSEDLTMLRKVAAMARTAAIDGAGTPRRHHIFAVVDDAAAVQHVERGLRRFGMQPEVLLPCDAPALEHPAQRAGLWGKVARCCKGLGGESHLATIYARHLRDGHLVLAVPARIPGLAQEAAQVIMACGGYDVTFFRGWWIEYLSPTENLAHKVPTHSTTSSDE